MERDDTILEFSALTTVHIAHNLQNFLSIMAISLDALVGRIPGTSRAQREITDLNAALDGAFRLSRELLAAVGLQQSREPLVIDVNELIVRFRPLLRRLLGDDIQLVVKEEEAALLVEATPVQLEWILLNLAANGRDAMPEGGVLYIETSSVDSWDGPGETAVRSKPCVCITVRDEGFGFPDHIRTRVFEPFFTTRSLGTGLGLTSVAVTVRALRGGLYVETVLRKGTSVHVLLPRRADAAPTPAPPAI